MSTDEISSDARSIEELQHEIAGLRAELTYRVRMEERFTGILSSALDAIISMDHRGRVVDWNPAAEKLFGYSNFEAAGQELASLIIPERLRDAHRRGLARYLETGESTILGTQVELRAIDADNNEFPVELGITEVRNEGPPLFTGYIRDLSQIKRLLAEQRFLFQAGEILSPSLGKEGTLHKLADLAVPELANMCIVYVSDEAGDEIRRFAVSYDAPELERFTNAIRTAVPLDPNARTGAPYVCRTGNSILYSDVTPEIFSSDVEQPEELLALTRDLDLKSWMCVALRGRKAIFGAVSFISTSSGHQYSEEDVTTAENLARRAALAIENARLHEQAKRALDARNNLLVFGAQELPFRLTMLRGSIQELRRQVTHGNHSMEELNGLIEILDSRVSELETLISDHFRLP